MRVEIDRIFLGIIGIVMLVMIIPLFLFGWYLYWVPHVPEHISKEIGVWDTIGAGLTNLILYVLVAVKFIRPKSKAIKMYLMSVIPIAFLNIYLIEYKHFLIYYKQYAYKIVFLKEGKEIRPLLPKRPEEIFKGYIGEPVFFKDKKEKDFYHDFFRENFSKNCNIGILYYKRSKYKNNPYTGIYLCKYKEYLVFYPRLSFPIFPSGSFLFKVKNSEEFIKKLKHENN